MQAGFANTQTASDFLTTSLRKPAVAADPVGIDAPAEGAQGLVAMQMIADLDRVNKSTLPTVLQGVPAYKNVTPKVPGTWDALYNKAPQDEPLPIPAQRFVDASRPKPQGEVVNGSGRGDAVDDVYDAMDAFDKKLQLNQASPR